MLPEVWCKRFGSLGGAASLIPSTHGGTFGKQNIDEETDRGTKLLCATNIRAELSKFGTV